MQVKEDRYNEYGHYQTKVSGKDLSVYKVHDKGLESAARQLLANVDEITDADVGPSSITVWVRREDLVNFEAPSGLRIAQATCFGDPEEHQRGGSMALDLEWDE